MIVILVPTCAVGGVCTVLLNLNSFDVYVSKRRWYSAGRLPFPVRLKCFDYFIQLSVYVFIETGEVLLLLCRLEAARALTS